MNHGVLISSSVVRTLFFFLLDFIFKSFSRRGTRNASASHPAVTRNITRDISEENFCG